MSDLLRLLSDLLISLQIPRELVPGAINLFFWTLCLLLGIFGIFIMRVYLHMRMKKQLRSHEMMSMSMMDIDTMHKRGLVSDTEYKAIRHSLAEREVERERRRKQTERERVILAQVAEDPEAARQLLTTASAPQPASLAATLPQDHAPQPHAHPQTQPQVASAAPRQQAQPQPASAMMSDLEREQARLFELSSTDTVLPELLQQPAPHRPPARPAAQRPAQARPQPAARPAQAPAPRSAPAQSHPTSVQGKPMSELELLLQKGAITPEEYQRLKAFVR